MVFQNNLLMGASGNQGEDYTIDDSCRFNSADSAYLTQTPGGSASSVRLGTISVWVKRSILSTQQALIHQQRTSDAYDALHIVFKTDDTLQFAIEGASGATVIKRITTQVFRDPSAWYHFVFAWDSNQTDDTACAVYVNGEAITAFETKTNPGSAQDLQWLNTSKAVWVGRSSSGSNLCDVYMSQMAVIDGSKLAASSFGETNSDTGQWVPTDITGLTYGNEGWLFAFQDSSALGDDTSGNGNDFTSSGLAAADQVTDSPTNNFCTMSPLNNTLYELSDGNLYAGFSLAATNVRGTAATMAYPTTGKWYWESKNEIGDNGQFGVRAYDGTQSVANFCTVFNVNSVNAYGFQSGNGYLWEDGSSSTSGVTLSQGDTMGVAFDVDSGKLWFSKNNTWISGDPADGSSPSITVPSAELANDIYPWGASDGNTAYQRYDFGQSGFAYTPPTGFSALSTANLDDPTIADPSAYFQTTLYTGTGSAASITNGGNSDLDPDLVWIKCRSQAYDHGLFDSVRGVQKELNSNDTSAEATELQSLTAFNSDGFSVGTRLGVNDADETFVAWQWLESATPGFDIVTYTGNDEVRTISHNLGVKPDMMIVKRRDGTQNWQVYHSVLTGTARILLDSTAAAYTDSEYWNDTEPTSSVFTLGPDDAGNGTDMTYVNYLFAGIEGFSKFGKYTGNGNADGPFIWTGFRPSTILLKRSDAVNDWTIKDNARNPYNVVSHALIPDANNTEYTATWVYVDFLSNGFKVRSTDNSQNTSGGTYLFGAWAETPFKTALAR